MSVLRRLVRNHSLAMALLCMITLTLRIVVPGGYMPITSHGQMVISICSGTTTTSMLVDVPGLKPPSGGGGHEDGTKHETPCAYAGLAMSALGAVPFDLLPAALRHAMDAGLRPTASWVSPVRAGLRPWVRGPPLPA